MRLTIVNLSTSISSNDFHAALRALSRQVNEDFMPEWGVGATLRASHQKLPPKGSHVPIDGVHDAIIYVGDSAADPTTGVTGALGYHSINHKHIPYGFIYLDVCKKYNEVWTSTLSHEILELLADPSAVLTVNGPDPRGGRISVYYDLEVCDPTQGDTYTIDSVIVSNFVTRRYFGMHSSSSSTNFLGLPLAAFGVLPGGYFQYEDTRGTHQINGKLAPKAAAARLSGRTMMKEGRRNTRRELRP